MALRSDETLTNYESICLFTMAFLSHMFGEVLPLLLQALGPAVWITQIITSLLAFAFFGIFWLLCRRYDTVNFLDICEHVYGTRCSKGVLSLFVFHLIVYISAALNNCVETLQVYAYSNISSLHIDLLVLGTACIIALYSIKGLAKMISVLLPLILAATLVILIASSGQYDIRLLTPILGTGVKEIGTFSVLLTSKFNEILLFSLMGSAFRSKKQYRSAVCIAIPIAGAVGILSSLCYCMAIPYSSADHIRVGIIGLAQGNWTGRYLQRLESTYIAVDVLANIMLIGYSFLLIFRVYCRIFSIRNSHRRATIVPLAAILLCCTRIISSNEYLQNSVRNYARYYSIFFCVGVLLVTWLVRLLRQQRVRRRMAVLLIPCLCLGLFTGCSNAREPDAEIYPIAIGYDVGVNQKYRITLKFMTENKSGTEKDTEEEQQSTSESDVSGLPGDCMVFEAASLSEGLHTLSSLMPRHISLLHIRFLVISEELAKEGIRDLVTPIIKFHQFKPTMPIIISRCSAYDMITSKDAQLSSSVQADTSLTLESAQESTFYLGVTLAQFVYQYDTPYGDAMAIFGNLNSNRTSQSGDLFAETPSSADDGYLAGNVPAIGNRDLELAGMAVFRDEKMVGTLNTGECQILSLLNNNTLSNVEIRFPDLLEPEQYSVTMELRRSRDTQISSFLEEDGTAHITIHADYKGLIELSQNTDAEYVNNPEQGEALCRHCENILTTRAYRLLQKLQSEYQADVLQLGREISTHFSTIQEWEAYRWKQHFPDAVIHVEFSIQL